MQLGTLSLSIGLGLDGSWVDLADQTVRGRWPQPPEMSPIARSFRPATIVDRQLNALLLEQRTVDEVEGRLIVADVTTDRHDGDVLGMFRLQRMLFRANLGFVHVAGGSALTAFALQTRLVTELDITIYPVIGGKTPVFQPGIDGFRRLSFMAHEDGRITSVWRLAGT